MTGSKWNVTFSLPDLDCVCGLKVVVFLNIYMMTIFHTRLTSSHNDYIEIPERNGMNENA